MLPPHPHPWSAAPPTLHELCYFVNVFLLCPPQVLGRLSSESCNVCGYEIPAKSVLVVNLWSLGRDPKLWEDPLEFKPERFMGMEASGKGNFDVIRGQHFELIPFGSRRISCPGASLAQQVVKTNLAAMIQCFEWKVNGEDGTVDMEEKPSTTLPRAHPLNMCTSATCEPPSFYHARDRAGIAK